MSLSISYRAATGKDATRLAQLNQQLIRDEGHRNPMTVEQLTARMTGWLAGEYAATLFEANDDVIGYALYRHEPDFVYLRHFFVRPEHRRRGIGRAAIAWLWANAWQSASRLRIEVLINNEVGRAFWKSIGFSEYCVTMEMNAPISQKLNPNPSI